MQRAHWDFYPFDRKENFLFALRQVEVRHVLNPAGDFLLTQQSLQGRGDLIGGRAGFRRGAVKEGHVLPNRPGDLRFTKPNKVFKDDRQIP